MQDEYVMELLDFCLTTTPSNLRINSANKKRGWQWGTLPLVVSNIFMEHFEKIALDTADHKPAKWLRYVDDIFMVLPHGPARLQQFLQYLNSLRPTIKFLTEVEDITTLPFLDILVMKRGPNLAMKVYQKPSHTGCYLLFKCNHPHYV
jgi:hypothetical protein